MSAGSSSLGRRVLELTTDASKLRQGLSEARQLTMQQTAEIKRAARVKLEVDIQKARADFKLVVGDATTARRLVEQQTRFKASVDLAQFKSDLRTAEREQAASFKKMQDQARAAERAQAAKGSLLGNVGGALAAGLGVGTGVALVGAGIGVVKDLAGKAATSIFEYNSAMERARDTITAFTKSNAETARQLAIVDADAGKASFGTLALVQALGSLQPVAKKSGESIQDLLQLTEILASLNKEQGITGAAFALGEQASGDVTSLVERFNIPRQALNNYRQQGLSDIQAVRRALADLGIDYGIVTSQAQGFTTQLAVGKEALTSFVASAGKPLFAATKDSLAAFIAFLNRPEVKQAGADVAAGLVQQLEDLREYLGRDDVKQDLLDVADAIGTIASSTATLAGVLKFQLGPVMETTRQILADFAKSSTSFFDDLGSGLGNLGDIFAGNTIAIKQFQWINSAATGASQEELQRRADEIAQLEADRANRARAYKPGRTYLTGAESTGTPEPGAAAPLYGTTPTAQPGYRSPAVAPESESQYQTSADRASGERYAAMLARGKADLQAYIKGFSADDVDLFGKLAPQLRDGFAKAFGGLDIAQQMEHGLGDLDTLTARIVADIRDTGSVSVETGVKVRAALGEETGNAVLGLAQQYAALAAASRTAESAADGLKEAQAGLVAIQQEATKHAEASAEALDALSRAQKAIGDEAAEIARGYDEQTTALQRQRDELARLTQAHQDEAQAQIDGLEAVKRAKSQDEAVKALEVKQRADLLALEERIRAARRAGDEKGARALEDQRGLVQARGNYAIDLARQRGAVANDQADAAKKPIEEAAAAQAKKDKDAATALDDRLRGVQEEAKRVADDYAARQRAIQVQIDRETERARVVAAADKLAITNGQTRVDLATTAKEQADKELIAAQKKTTEMQAQQTALDTYLGTWRDFIKELEAKGVDVAKFFGGSGATGVPVTPAPRPQQTGPDPYYDPGQRTPGDNLRLAPSGYTPPVPPSNSAAYTAGRGVAGAALRAGSQRPITVSLSFPNMVVRETADIDGVIDRAANVAGQRFLQALKEDEQAGGLLTTYVGA